MFDIPSLPTLIQLILNGLLLGGVFALFSVGLSLSFGVMKVVNFAYGEFIMLAMFATFLLATQAGLSPYVSILLLGPAFFVLGLALQRFVIQPVLDGPHVSQLFVTVGLSIALLHLGLLLFSADARITPSILKGQGISIGFVRLNYDKLAAFAVAIVMAAMLYWFLKFTPIGKAIRATSQDAEAAELMGVNIRRTQLITSAIGLAGVGVAGAILAPMFPTYPQIGPHLVLIAFATVILGGLGNVFGTMLAGLLIGVIYSVAGYVSPPLTEIYYFGIMLFVLWVRPEGLFGLRVI